MRVRVAEDSLLFEVYNTRRGKTQAKNRGNVLLFSRIRKFPRVLPPSDALYDREQVCRGYWESLMVRSTTAPGMSQRLLFSSAIVNQLG
jgi:hypothetical protein